jgi:hypothetical protein
VTAAALAVAPLGSALAAAAAAAAAVGQVAFVEGEVAIGRGEPEAYHPARTDESVFERDLVLTHKRSRIRIRIGETGALTLGENTKLRITAKLLRASSAPRLAALHLDEGLALAAFDAAAAASLALSSPAAWAEPAGAAAALVQVAPGGRTTVTVLDGAVEVGARDGAGVSVTVHAGEQTVVDPGHAPTPPAPAPGRTPAPGGILGGTPGGGPAAAGAAPGGPGASASEGRTGAALRVDAGGTAGAGVEAGAGTGPGVAADVHVSTDVVSEAAARIDDLLGAAGLGGALPALPVVALDVGVHLGAGAVRVAASSALGAVGAGAAASLGALGADGPLGLLPLDPGSPVTGSGLVHVNGVVEFRP